MFLTRLGFDSKMVVTGDVTQIDLPREQQSGLVVVGEILDEVEGIDFVRFGGEDVVRHKLVQRIVEAYDEHAAAAAPELRPADRDAAGPTTPCSRSRSSAPRRRRRADGRAHGGCVTLAVALGGDRGRPRRRRSSSTPTASASSTASTAARTRRPTCCRSRSTSRRAPDAARPARARRRRDLPAAHGGPARGGRPRRAAPRRAWTTRPTTARCSRSRRELLAVGAR